MISRSDVEIPGARTKKRQAFGLAALPFLRFVTVYSLPFPTIGPEFLITGKLGLEK